MNDQVKRSITASRYSGSNAVHDVETLGDLATLARKEVDDQMPRAARGTSDHDNEGSDDDRNGTTGGGSGS
jgi:hypothetical protein